MIFLNILKCFFIILVTTAAQQFFGTLTSLNSISEPSSKVYLALGATNDGYEALCHVRMYVCMYLKVSVNYFQQVQAFVFFHKIQWVNMF